MLTPLGKKGLLAFDGREATVRGEAWEGKLRSEYLASSLQGAGGGIDRLGAEEAMLAVSRWMLAGGANLQQAAYVALAGAMLESRQLGQTAIGGHGAAGELLGGAGAGGGGEIRNPKIEPPK